MIVIKGSDGGQEYHELFEVSEDDSYCSEDDNSLSDHLGEVQLDYLLYQLLDQLLDQLLNIPQTSQMRRRQG